MVPQLGSVFRGTFELDATPFDWGKDYKRPNLAPEEVVVYEMGVRSFTADESSKLAPGQLGTYTGLMAKVRVVHTVLVLYVTCNISGSTMSQRFLLPCLLSLRELMLDSIWHDFC